MSTDGHRLPPARVRQAMLWVNDVADLAKVRSWINWRSDLGDVMIRPHADSGAVSVCFFRGDRSNAGIIRCASAPLADAALKEFRAIQRQRGIE